MHALLASSCMAGLFYFILAESCMADDSPTIYVVMSRVDVTCTVS